MKPSCANTAELRAMLTEMVAEAEDLKAAAGGPVTEAVADWLAPQYLLAARARLAASGEAGRFEVLRTFLHDWAMLRRGDHAAARLQLDREELDWQRANSKSEMELEFREWLKRPEIRAEIFPDRTGGFSLETLHKMEKELGLL